MSIRKLLLNLTLLGIVAFIVLGGLHDYSIFRNDVSVATAFLISCVLYIGFITREFLSIKGEVVLSNKRKLSQLIKLQILIYFILIAKIIGGIFYRESIFMGFLDLGFLIYVLIMTLLIPVQIVVLIIVLNKKGNP